MATYIYTVQCDDCMEGSYALPTLSAARHWRRQMGLGDAEITKIEIAELSIRDRYCAIYNREGFAKSQVETP